MIKMPNAKSEDLGKQNKLISYLVDWLPSLKISKAFVTILGLLKLLHLISLGTFAVNAT